MGRAGLRAGGRIGAVDAARGFPHGAFLVEGDDHVVEVQTRTSGWAQFQVLEGDLHARFAVDWHGLSGVAVIRPPGHGCEK